MPMPLSCTRSCSTLCPPLPTCVHTSTLTCPLLLAINLSALLIRLNNIWCKRVGSVYTHSGTAGSMCAVRLTPFLLATVCMSSTLPFTSARICTGRYSMSSLPASIFEKSRISFKIRSSDWVESYTTPIMRRCSGKSLVCCSMSSIPNTPFMGVRISWLMFAKNSDFAWLADKLFCSSSFLAVMSVHTSMYSVAESFRPPTPIDKYTLDSTQKSSPFLLRLHTSACQTLPCFTVS